MKKSKYLNQIFGSWECTHVGVARVQPVYRDTVGPNGKKLRNKFPGHQSYYYIFERLTSDQKAMKMIRLNARQVRQVLDQKHTVEDFARKKELERSQVFTQKVSYAFCD